MTKAKTISYLKQQIKKSNDNLDKMILGDKSWKSDKGFREADTIRKSWIKKLNKVLA